MRKLIIVSAIVLAGCTCALLRAQTDQEVDARKTALDLAGAFSNDGFKIRDGHWSGALQPKEHAVIAVNLYAGNQYWFTAGASNDKGKVGVEIYDETGRQVAAENYSTAEKAAAGFSPSSSGEYFVSVTLLEGPPASVSLICSYK